MIRLATRKDLTKITELVQAVVKKMQTHGYKQWDETYPTKSEYLKDIDREELYVYDDLGKLSGLFTLSTRGHAEYTSIKWLSDEPAWTIKRLAIAPKRHGQGLADQLIQFSEESARKSGIYRLNADTYEENVYAKQLFHRHHFQLVDQREDPRNKGLLFYYEKILSKEGD